MAKRKHEPMSMKQARKKAGLLQKDIAEKMGVSASTVCLWETGQVSITAKDLFTYCEIIGVSVSDIFLPKQIS